MVCIAKRLPLDSLRYLASLAPEREQASSTPSARSTEHSDDHLARRIRAYLDTTEPSIQGQNGSAAMMRVMAKLVRGWDLKPSEAWEFACYWNDRKAVPPWSEAELRRAIDNADKESGPRGDLRNAQPSAKRVGGEAIPATNPDGTGAKPRMLVNYIWDEQTDGEKVRSVRRGRPVGEIFDDVVKHTGGWPRQCGKLLFVEAQDHACQWLQTPQDYFGWLGRQFGGKGVAGYDWHSGTDCVNKAEFYAASRQVAERCVAVEHFPHYPPMPGVHYLHPEIPAATGRNYLGQLLARFLPATPEDDDLLRAAILTVFWGGSPGQRPLFLIEADDTVANGKRGAGKSVFVEMLAYLVSRPGYPGLVLLDTDEDRRDVQVRLLSPEARTARIALYDNVKKLRVSDSNLEAMITAEYISGRQLHVGDGSRLNTLSWFMTCNNPMLSKDLASRGVSIKIGGAKKTPHWIKQTKAFIDAHRWDIVAEIRDELTREVAIPDDVEYSRRPEWDAEVLAKCGDLKKLLALLQDRRSGLDDDEEQAQEIADAIRSLLKAEYPGEDPDEICVLIPSITLHEKVVKDLFPKEYSKGQRNSLKSLVIAAVPNLKMGRDKLCRGMVWTGSKCEPTVKARRWTGLS